MNTRSLASRQSLRMSLTHVELLRYYFYFLSTLPEWLKECPDAKITKPELENEWLCKPRMKM